jgi:hypothetical protein
LPWEGFELTTFVVIGTDCTGSCKSIYRMTTMVSSTGNIQIQHIQQSYKGDKYIQTLG